ncbi:MAG: BON domain-containing protein [Planctomycetes bacterium]|nr:BON domain-containing protein [Planctomycetota bacterium]
MSFDVRTLSAGFLTAIIAAAMSASAEAQTNSLFGNSGPLSTTGNATQRGGSAVSGGGAGLSGNQLNTGAPGTAQLGDLSSTIGQGGFIGRSDSAGRFVGNTNAGQQSTRTNRTFQAVQGGGNRGQTTGGNFGRNAGGGSASQSIFRPVQRVAFVFQRRPVASVRASIQVRLDRLALRSARFKGLSFSMNGTSEVVLRGKVKTASTRNLVAALAKLEPGVRKVRNEIVVESDE